MSTPKLQEARFSSLEVYLAVCKDRHLANRTNCGESEPLVAAIQSVQTRFFRKGVILVVKSDGVNGIYGFCSACSKRTQSIFPTKCTNRLVAQRLAIASQPTTRHSSAAS